MTDAQPLDLSRSDRSLPGRSLPGRSLTGPTLRGPALPVPTVAVAEPVSESVPDSRALPEPALLAFLSLGADGSESVQDRLAGWLSDFADLHEHTERLSRTRGSAATLQAVLESGAALLGADRGLITTTAPGAGRAVGLGLDRADVGALETVPAEHGPFAGLLSHPARAGRLLIADLGAADGGAPDRTIDPAVDPAVDPAINPAFDPAINPAIDPRFREIAAQLGLGACYALPLGTEADGPLGAVAWFYDEPAAPDDRRQHLAQLYCEFASHLLAKELAAERARRTAEALRRSLLPDRLPTVPGVRLAARWVPADLDHSAGSDWYDAVALADGSIGLTVGSVSGGGPGAGPGSAPGAAAAMGRVRAALRAYAVLEGEDPVSVLGDLELLLKTTEPTRSATAVYAWLDPDERRITLAGAGHCPPVLVNRYGADFVETSLSAPLGMLSCWEAPGVEVDAERGDVLVLYTEGLARRFGPSLHAGQAALRRAAAEAPRGVRLDPDRLCAHLLACCADAEAATGAAGTGAATAGAGAGATDDLVLLAARFE